VTLRLLRRPFPELPLLRKEIVGLLRMKRAFWLLVFTVGVSSLLPLLSWPSAGSIVVESERTVLSAAIFLLTQLTVALLIIPAFAAGAISGEREQGTYDLLHATLLSPGSIVVSKALAAVGYVMLLLLASAPAVAVLQLLGGVSLEGILKCYAITFSAVVMSALVCLWASMRSERTARAVLRGAVGVVFWNGGLLFLLWLGIALLEIRRPPPPLTEIAFHANMALSPHFAVVAQLSGESSFFPLSSSVTGLAADAWIAHAVGTAIVSLFYFARLLRRVRSPDAAAPLASRWAARRARKRRGPVRRPILTHVVLALGAGGGPLGNPVFQKEIRSEFFGRVWYRRIVFGACALIFLGIFAVNNLRIRGAIGGIVGVALFLVAVLSPGVAASAFPREIEQGNLDFLRGTLVPLRQALRGKFLASLYATFGIIAAAGLTILISVVASSAAVPRWPSESRGWLLRAIFVPAGVLIATWVLATAVATLASVLAKRTLGALVGSYAALLAWFVILPIVWLVATGGDGAGFLIVTHPLGALFAALERSKDEAILGFFLFHAALTLALWFASSFAVESLRGRDP
jgi:ABC-type transport system involved in multi-copper enzyme maturation permease subunit